MNESGNLQRQLAKLERIALLNLEAVRYRGLIRETIARLRTYQNAEQTPEIEEQIQEGTGTLRGYQIALTTSKKIRDTLSKEVTSQD